MAIKGRKQLAVHITDAHHAALMQIKEETNLSNAKLIEFLVDHYVQTASTSTNISSQNPLEALIREMTTSINININSLREEVLTTSTSISTSAEETTNTNTNTKEPFHRATHLLNNKKEEPEFLSETRYDNDTGEPYAVQVVNPEYLYGKIETAESPRNRYDFDENDPIEKMLKEKGMHL